MEPIPPPPPPGAPSGGYHPPPPTEPPPPLPPSEEPEPGELGAQEAQPRREYGYQKEYDYHQYNREYDYENRGYEYGSAPYRHHDYRDYHDYDYNYEHHRNHSYYPQDPYGYHTEPRHYRHHKRRKYHSDRSPRYVQDASRSRSRSRYASEGEARRGQPFQFTNEFDSMDAQVEVVLADLAKERGGNIGLKYLTKVKNGIVKGIGYKVNDEFACAADGDMATWDDLCDRDFPDEPEAVLYKALRPLWDLKPRLKVPNEIRCKPLVVHKDEETPQYVQGEEGWGEDPRIGLRSLWNPAVCNALFKKKIFLPDKFVDEKHLDDWNEDVIKAKELLKREEMKKEAIKKEEMKKEAIKKEEMKKEMRLESKVKVKQEDLAPRRTDMALDASAKTEERIEEAKVSSAHKLKMESATEYDDRQEPEEGLWCYFDEHKKKSDLYSLGDLRKQASLGKLQWEKRIYRPTDRLWLYLKPFPVTNRMLKEQAGYTNGTHESPDQSTISEFENWLKEERKKSIEKYVKKYSKFEAL